MAGIGIVTDSSSDIPDEYAKNFAIEIVPLYVGYEDKLFKDIIEIKPEEVFSALEKGLKVKTAAPSAGDFLNTFKYIFDNNKDFIYCFTLSSKLSGTYNAANTAVSLLKDAKNNIKVIDTKTSTISMGLIVLGIARAVKKGCSMEEIDLIIAEMIKKTKFLAVLESFEHVLKGGRAAFMSKFLSKAMRVTPILTIGRSGKVHLAKFAKNKGKALLEIYKKTVNIASLNKSNSIGIFYGSDIAPAKELEKLIMQNKSIIIEEIILTQITTVISAHTGPGIWGVAISPRLI